MSDRAPTDYETSLDQDELALYAQRIETALDDEDFPRVIALIEADPAATWFGLPPTRTSEILQLLLRTVPAESRLLQIARLFYNQNSSGRLDSPEFLASLNFDDPREVYMLSVLRLGEFRLAGRTKDAMEQGAVMEQQLGEMQPLLDSYDGWALQTAVQLGVTAMLAGGFTRALTNFTRAQMHVPVPKFAFLTRDALAKSALIHACFGNLTTARS